MSWLATVPPITCWRGTANKDISIFCHLLSNSLLTNLHFSQEGKEIFLFSETSAPALWLTHPPTQWVPRVSPLPLGVKLLWRKAQHHQPVLKLRMSGYVPVLPQYTVMAWTDITLHFYGRKLRLQRTAIEFWFCDLAVPCRPNWGGKKNILVACTAMGFNLYGFKPGVLWLQLGTLETSQHLLESGEEPRKRVSR